MSVAQKGTWKGLVDVFTYLEQKQMRETDQTEQWGVYWFVAKREKVNLAGFRPFSLNA
jgi:hypothetical protein